MISFITVSAYNCTVYLIMDIFFHDSIHFPKIKVFVAFLILLNLGSPSFALPSINDIPHSQSSDSHPMGPYPMGSNPMNPNPMDRNPTNPYPMNPYPMDPNSMGPNPMGPYSMASNPMSPYPLSSNPLGSHPGPHPMASHPGPHPMASNPFGPNPMGPNPMGQNPMYPSAMNQDPFYPNSGPRSNPMDIGLEKWDIDALEKEVGQDEQVRIRNKKSKLR